MIVEIKVHSRSLRWNEGLKCNLTETCSTGTCNVVSVVLISAMYGKSWAGFNGLQVASMQPPALKTVISTYSSDERYLNDCHYRGGCVLAREMPSWAHVMLLWNARPPRPESLGSRYYLPVTNLSKSGFR